MGLAEARGIPLEGLSLEELRSVCPLIEADIYALLSPEASVARRVTPGGVGRKSVRAQIRRLKKWLEKGNTG